MLNHQAALSSLRGWRGRVIWAAVGAGLAIGFAVGVLRGGRTVPLIEACRVQATAAAPDRIAQLGVANVCLRAFMSSLDPASGARAARALSKASFGRALVEALAASIGDQPDGADAWLAVGNDRRALGAAAAAVTAYQRALAHRDGDVAGMLRDNTGLVMAYRKLDDLRNTSAAAAAAYDLLSRDVPTRDRRAALLAVASASIHLGNLQTARRLLEDAQAITPPSQSDYPALQERLGFVEQALHHPLAAKRAYEAARNRVRHTANEWPLYTNLLELALDEGNVAEARLLLALSPRTPDLPDDRATADYDRARLLIAQGQFLEAAQLCAQALARAPGTWTERFEGLRGHALQVAGDNAAAEPALLHAVARVEMRRNELANDTLKSWLLARQRAPFEDLFLVYIAQGRTLEALAIVQRATARSLLDGLLESPADAESVHDEIVSGDAHEQAMRSIARSLRNSRSAEVPPIATVIERLRGAHVVTYFQARHDLWAIVVSPNGAVVAHRIAAIDEVARAVDGWLKQPARADVAERLGMTLLPDDAVPQTDAVLYVIPDAPVREVSFAALRRHGAYVIERNPVAYGLSAASLSAPARPAGTGADVVIGDPLGDLPSARVEAIEVARALGVAAHLGREAALAIVALAADAAVLHIGAHTDSLSNGPAIHLADGNLDAAMVLEHPISTRLVVLLGCSSARAREKDELAPLASAFLAAGAHAVVASLWAVDDRVGREFARAFYRGRGTRDPIRSLANAQRQLARDGAPVEQWSTFVVLGGLGSNMQGEP